MRPRVAVMRNMPLHRPQGVAIVGIYPCGKARNSPPGAVLLSSAPPIPSTAAPLPLASHDSRSALAVKGSLRRSAPWTAPGRPGEGRLYEGKGGVLAVRTGRKGTFRPYPPRGELGRLREHATATDPDKRDRLMEGLDVFLERERDRELFGLAPKQGVVRRGPLEADSFAKKPLVSPVLS